MCKIETTDKNFFDLTEFNACEFGLIFCVLIGTCFKTAKSYDRAADAFKKAADAHSNSNAYPLLSEPIHRLTLYLLHL